MSLKVVGSIPASNLPRVNARNEWTVYGNDYCPFTRRVKDYLDEQNISYVYHLVEHADRATLKQRTGGQATIPVVYHYDQLVGGCDQFLAQMGEKE